MAQANPRLRRSTAIEHEAARMLQHEGIQCGSTIMLTKKPLNRIAGEDDVILKTNVFGLTMKRGVVYRYDATVFGYISESRKIELTKKVSSDSIYADRRLKCRNVMEAFKMLYADFLQLNNNNCIYYDLQALLYSLNPLNVNGESGRIFGVPSDQVAVGGAGGAFLRYEILIKCLAEGRAATVTLGDLSCITADVGHLDKDLTQFLNLATSQEVMFDKINHVTYSSAVSYLLDPPRYNFAPEDSPIFPDNGTYLGIGAQKGVRFIEGPKATRHAALTVEVKKTPFHVIEPAIQKAAYYVSDVNNLYANTLSNVERERLNMQLKGLTIEKNYGDRKMHIIHNISPTSALTTKFKYNNVEVTIYDYFFQRYNITLAYPDAPLLGVKMSDGGICNFPMEVCIISDNQRVKPHQQTAKQAQDMIKKCAVPPSLLFEQIKNTANSLKLSQSEYLTKAGMRFIGTPLSMAHRLAPPTLEYGRSAMSTVNTNNFTWQGHEFIVPAKCNRWAAYCFDSGSRESLSESDYNRFLLRFLNEARQRGMALSDPADLRFGRSNPNELINEVRVAAEHGCEFILVAHPDAADEMHAALKLCERDYRVITQGLKIGTIRNVITKGQPQTLQNIVNKTNVKLGGLNYSLSLNNPVRQVLGTNTLFIGFAMNHPAGRLGEENGNGSNGNGNGSNGNGTGSVENTNGNGNGSSPDRSREMLDNRPPSVIGFAANVGVENEFEFVGDFLYQELRRDEKVNIIRDVLRRCVMSYRENRRAEPKRVIVFRNGCSEGQFANVLKYEVPLMNHELSVLTCEAKVTVIISNKLHTVRFFKGEIDPRARSTEQNVYPGTVVNTCVTHPYYCEYFLNSHRALQGTARTPKYTMVYDANNLSVEEVEAITNHLCYGHQIVFLPTSLPSPVYIALRYAERGSMMYRRFRTVTSSDSDPKSFQDLTERLSYQHVPHFAQRRINA